MNTSENLKLRKLIISALFAAITTIATIIIRIPSLGPSGYINFGDSIVLLCALTLGGGYGAMAAGIGSALADIFSGYIIYAPATFIIKFFVCLSVFGIYQILKANKLHSLIKYIIPAITGELIMIVGYFLFECFILGYGITAYMPAISNLFQAVANLAIFIPLIYISNKFNLIKH